MAFLHGVGFCIWPASNSPPRFNHHSYPWLATCLLVCRYRGSRRLVPAKIHAATLLESKRRLAEADDLMTRIEGESTSLGPPHVPREATTLTNNLSAFNLFGETLLPRLLVSSIRLIVINALIFGFVTWLPTFFVHQSLTLTRSFSCTLRSSLAALIGCVIGAFAADRIGRRPTTIGASVCTWGI